MKYKITKGFVIQKNGDKITIFDPETSTLHTFNETAGAIMSGIKKHLEIPIIVELLQKKYSISEEVATDDVKEVIDKLLSLNIIAEDDR